jgi:hypothetical protein
MAVEGKKTFQQFDILTAVDTNAYLTNDPRTNLIINGGMDIWQRGTSPIAGAGSATTGFGADRWQCYRSGYAGNSTILYNNSTGLAGFQNSLYYVRNSSSTSTAAMFIAQSIETRNAIVAAGNTITLSFYVRAGATFSAAGGLINGYVSSGTGTDQNISSGFTGSITVVGKDVTTTTSWQRVTMTGDVPSNSKQLAVLFAWTPVGTAGASDYIEITGVQLEIGSGATPFRRSGGTIQGELANCQRYYVRINGDGDFGFWGSGTQISTSASRVNIPLNVKLRSKPISITMAGSNNIYAGATVLAITAGSPAQTYYSNGANSITVEIAHATGGTVGFGLLAASVNGSVNNYIELNSEL